MAIPNRLLVRDIQIYFDGNRALHGCPRGLDLPAIQTEPGEYRNFIDRWLEASELRKPVKLSDEEEALGGWRDEIIRAQKFLGLGLTERPDFGSGGINRWRGGFGWSGKAC